MRKIRDELLDGPARVQKAALSPAVRAALESLLKAQAERVAAIAKLIKRIRVTELTTCCLTCKRAYTEREFNELGGECASSECDSYLKHLTPAGIEKANLGRRPVTIADAEKSAGDPHSGRRSMHRPWVGADNPNGESRPAKFPPLSADSGTADAGDHDAPNGPHDPDLVDQPARLRRPQPGERSRSKTKQGTLDGIRLQPRSRSPHGGRLDGGRL